MRPESQACPNPHICRTRFMVPERLSPPSHHSADRRLRPATFAISLVSDLVPPPAVVEVLKVALILMFGRFRS